MVTEHTVPGDHHRAEADGLREQLRLRDQFIQQIHEIVRQAARELDSNDPDGIRTARTELEVALELLEERFST